MSDIEMMTMQNHERARQRELGERWERLKQLRGRRERARREGMAVCFFATAFVLGASATALAVGNVRAALAALVVAGLMAVGVWMLAEAR